MRAPYLTLFKGFDRVPPLPDTQREAQLRRCRDALFDPDVAFGPWRSRFGASLCNPVWDSLTDNEKKAVKASKKGLRHGIV